MEKFKNYYEDKKNPHLLKLLRIMKVTCFLIFISLFQISAETYSQATKLTLNMKNVALSEIFIEIENISEFRFFYDSNEIDPSSKVTIKTENTAIEEVLNIIFQNSKISYEIVDRFIILTRVGSVPLNKRTFVWQEQRTVSGKVTDSMGQPLPGVSIVIKGTTQGTVTDTEGEYNLTNISPDAILVFSFVGMKTREVNVGNQRTINISMEEETIGIEEVVAVGYGTTKRGELTSSISSLDNEIIERQTVQRLEQSMQGQLAGVQIVNRSGRPGTNPVIRVRGSSTINNNDPLYVVDGIQTDNINNINPADIENISVLKDAGATIYGAQAANGVILITTKKGTKGLPQINLDLSYGFKEVSNYPDMMNTEQFTRIYNESRNAAGLAPYWDLNNLPPYDTEWLPLIFRTAPVTDNNISVSGGNENSTYLLGANYMNEDGIVKHTGFTRYNIRLNTNHAVIDKIRIGNTLTIGQEDIESSAGNMLEIFVTPMRAAPTIPVRWTEWDALNNPLFESRGWEVGEFAGPSRAGEHPGSKNPVGYLEDHIYTTLNKNFRAVGSLFGEYEPINDLVYRVQFGADYVNNTGISFNKPFSYGTKSISSDPYSKSKSTSFYYSFDNQIEYIRSINEIHNLKLLVGMSARKNYSENLGVNMMDFIDLDLNVVNAGSTVSGVSGTNSTEKWISYFGRFNYDYLGKYLLQAIFRIDGSSKFGPKNKFGYFPSVSGAWRISEEQFFNSGTIDNLKLRASWGQTGNDRIPSFAYVESLSFSNTVFGDGQEVVKGVYPSSVANLGLKWETVELADIGLEVGVLDNRLNLAIDWFNKKTKDMLLRRPIPNSYGYSSNPWFNAGSMKTEGWDFDLAYADNIEGWNFRVSVNGSTYRNEVLSLGAENELVGEVTKTEVGKPINYFYGYQTNGLFQNQTEIDNHAFQNVYSSPGDIRFVDLNGDDVINTDDRTMIGNPFPDLTYGGNIYLEKKGFDLNITGSGVIGNEIYRLPSWGGFESPIGRQNLLAFTADYWSEDNKHNDVTKPRPIWNDPNNNNGNSDRYISDGSYFRLNTIQLGYTFNNNLLNRIGFTNVRLYITGTNLLTLTSYIGFDPEVGGDTTGFGIDNYTSYPKSRGFIFGAQIKL
jgi:TonB-dependent starch-binding outer membrane protein SusC